MNTAEVEQYTFSDKKNYPRSKGIYCIENITNGKKYIGQTADAYGFSGRWQDHINALNNRTHANAYLLRAWIKDKAEAFVFSVLEVCSVDDLDSRESHYIIELNTLADKHGYNFEIPKYNGKKLVSEITRAKISEARKGCVVSAITRAKISAANKGRQVPEHVKEIMRVKMTGRKRKPEDMANAIAARTGSTVSNITKAKISKAKLGKKLSEAHALALSIGHRSEPFKLINAATGELFIGYRLAAFAKSRDLQRSNLNRVASGRVMQYKGWFKWIVE